LPQLACEQSHVSQHLLAPRIAWHERDYDPRLIGQNVQLVFDAKDNDECYSLLMVMRVRLNIFVYDDIYAFKSSKY
jgi:hypothetical protein